MEINYKNPVFYTDEVRKQFEIVDKVNVNTLPTLGMVKPYYELHLFSDNYIAVFNGKTYLKPYREDYLRYGLRTIDNRTKIIKMHRLVGFWLLEGWSEGLVIDHLNADKLDNVSSNLEWVTNLENVLRQKERILGKKVLNHGQIESIVSLYDSGKTEIAIAKEFNVTQPAISQILSGKRWKSHPAVIEYLNRLKATS